MPPFSRNLVRTDPDFFPSPSEVTREAPPPLFEEPPGWLNPDEARVLLRDLVRALADLLLELGCAHPGLRKGLGRLSQLELSLAACDRGLPWAPGRPYGADDVLALVASRSHVEDARDALCEQLSLLLGDLAPAYDEHATVLRLDDTRREVHTRLARGGG